MEIELVDHKRGNALGKLCPNLTVTDMANELPVNTFMKDYVEKLVSVALVHVSRVFPIIGVGAENGLEFIDHHFFD